MGLIDRLLGRETRSQTAKASDPFLAEYFGMRGLTGSVNPEAVLSNLSVAARCVALRSELLASVGLHLYRRTANGGRERADDNPLYEVLHDVANAGMTAYEMREFMVRSLDTHGNAYARLERNARGQVTALYPLRPETVSPELLTSGRLRYRVTDARGGASVLLDEEIMHVRASSRDGMVGISPIQLSRGVLALPLAQADMAGKIMENGLQPSGLLSFPANLSAQAHESIRKQMKERHGGAANAGKLLILDGGAKFDRIEFSADDQQFLESRKLSNEDVARIFNVPPTTVGILDRGTYSNVEHESQALIQNCLGPLAARVEAAMMRCLLTPAARRTYYIEHDLNKLLRGDVKSRFQAYRIGREIGAFSPNDVRRRENEPPIENGDTYHQPANWSPLGTTEPPGGAS